MSHFLGLIESPEVDHPLRSELAQEYQKDQAKFMKNAAEYTKKYAEPR